MFWGVFLDEVLGISRRIKISHFKEFRQKNVISFSSPMFYFSHFLLFLHTLHNLGHRNAIEMKSQVQTLNIETVFLQDVKVKFSSNFSNTNLVLQQQNIFWINLEKRIKCNSIPSWENEFWMTHKVLSTTYAHLKSTSFFWKINVDCC